MTSKTLRTLAVLAALCSALALSAAPKLWQSEGIVISDLGKAAMPQENLTRQTEGVRNKWELVDYETVRHSGTMLFSRRGTVPEPVTIDPKLTGWHRIYIATWSGEGFRLWARLDGDPSPSMFTQQSTSAGGYWSATEQGEEIFWKCADLTGRKITFGKPAGNAQPRAGIMWLRFEPMTEEEVAAAQAEFSRKEDKRLHAHSDMDWIHLYGHDATVDELASIIDAYAQSDVGVASVEVYSTLSDMTEKHRIYEGPDASLLEFRWASQLGLDERRAEVYGEYCRRAKQYGIKLLAAHRMSIANFLIPTDDICCSNLPIVTDNPQWWCRDRDGEPVACLSYAYPEVGDYMIKEFLRMADMGFDGGTLILTRGIHLLFEEPVVQRFKALYPDVDPCTLSLTDARLAAVRCEIFNGFMRRLRAAFDDYSEKHNRPRLLINTYVNLGLADNKVLGLDVETWVKEGLVDMVCVAGMRVFENEEAFRDDAHPGLLSVAKYHEYKKTAKYSPIRRQFGNLPDLQIKCMPEYAALSKAYGVPFHYDIQWEGSQAPEKIPEYVQRLYDGGAENLSMWDCFEYRVSCRPEWFVTSRLGHKETLKELVGPVNAYRRLFRVLSLNGLYLDGYFPSWRG